MLQLRAACNEQVHRFAQFARCGALNTSLNMMCVCTQVLSAAADALAAQRRPDALRTVVAFADSLPAHVPQSIYQELNRALNRTLT